MMAKILLSNNELYDKLLVHKQGLKHYAFSVFLFDKKNRFLLQKRSQNKYHSGGLWSNTCCSHFANEDDLKNRSNVVKERLYDELGVKLDDNSKLCELCVFEYNSAVENNLIENEIDYIFIGRIDEDNCQFLLNPDEVEEIKFVDFYFLKKNLDSNSSKYTTWLRLILDDKSVLFKMNEYLSKK